MPLQRVSFEEIVALLPEETPAGPVTFSIHSPLGSAPLTVALTANEFVPSLLTADGSGRGAALATATRINADGSTTTEPAYRCGGMPWKCATVALDLGPAPDQTIVTLATTGMRKVSVDSIGVAIGGLSGKAISLQPADNAPGVDLLQISVDPLAIGADEVAARISANGRDSNPVLLNFGRLPRLVDLAAPAGLAIDAGGSLVIADQADSTIMKLSPAGLVSKIAGISGNGGWRGDGELAVQALLRGPAGIAIDQSGRIYVADPPDHRVRRIDPDGTIATVAGRGSGGFGGDGGLAIEALLNQPSGVAVDAKGVLYIADRLNGRIRRVDPNGKISSVSTGDFKLLEPVAVALDQNGDLLVVDYRLTMVLRIGPNGAATPIAGTSQADFDGDGGPARAARLRGPMALAVDADGNIYVADADDHRVRKINVDGTITTVAGTGSPGSGNQGDPASQVELNAPSGVAIDAAGTLLISDTANHRIVGVTVDGTIETVTGTQ
jgi:sugar lactone lactonase YvrE